MSQDRAPEYVPVRCNAKLYFEEPDAVDLGLLVATLQRWIQQDRLPDEVMIDVADYRHLARGTRAVLVCHEGQYLIDDADGALGLLHSPRQRRAQSLDGALQASAARLLFAAAALEADLPWRFCRDRVRVLVQDRLFADPGAAWNRACTTLAKTLFGVEAVQVTEACEEGVHWAMLCVAQSASVRPLLRLAEAA